MRTVVGVLRGGPSSEYDVSLKTGATVLRELDKDKEWVNGFFQIQKQFTRILEELNIKKIAALGAKFDPHQHEAIGAKESEREEGIVLEEHESGYIWQDKVLRPAKVIVSK